MTNLKFLIKYSNPNLFIQILFQLHVHKRSARDGKDGNGDGSRGDVAGDGGGRRNIPVQPRSRERNEAHSSAPNLRGNTES